MNKLLKNTLIGASLLPAISLAGVVKGNTGRYCVGNTNEIRLDGKYVERVLISAEGIRNAGFINVYADGVKVSRIGVPGYDPDYTFRVRRNVEHLTLKFEDTCSRILDYTVFTSGPDHKKHGKRYNKERAQESTWGMEVLNIIGGFNNVVLDENLNIHPLYTEIFQPLKQIAMYQNASESERDARDVEMMIDSLKIAKIIRDNKVILFHELDLSEHEYIVADLLTVMEDILEETDVKEGEIEEMIEALEIILEE